MASSSRDGTMVTSDIMSAIHNARKAIAEGATATMDTAQSIRHKNDLLTVRALGETIMAFAKFDQQLEGWSQVIDKHRYALTQYSQNDADDQQQMDSQQDMHQTINQECRQSQNDICESHLLAHRFVKDYQDATGFTVGDDMTDDIVATQSSKSTICPITQKEMVDPVKNRTCKHTYSRQGILQHIRNRGTSNRCPISGCRQSVSESDLIPDEQMQALIRSSQN